MVFQDPVDSLNPRRSVEGTRRRLAAPAELTPGEVSAADRRALARIALDPSILRPPPQPAVRRSGAAGRDRPGARARPRPRRLRRADLGARRHRAGADPRADRATDRRPRAQIGLHLARPGHRPPDSPTGSWCSTSGRSSRRARSTTSSATPATPTPGRCCPAPRACRRRFRRPRRATEDLERRTSPGLRARAALPLRAPALHRRAATARRGGAGRAAACWRVGELEASVVAIPEERA